MIVLVFFVSFTQTFYISSSWSVPQCVLGLVFAEKRRFLHFLVSIKLSVWFLCWFSSDICVLKSSAGLVEACLCRKQIGFTVFLLPLLQVRHQILQQCLVLYFLLLHSMIHPVLASDQSLPGYLHTIFELFFL